MRKTAFLNVELKGVKKVCSPIIVFFLQFSQSIYNDIYSSGSYLVNIYWNISND